MGELIHPLEAETCPQAWLKAVEYLSNIKERSTYNLVLGVNRPEVMEPGDFLIYDHVDAFLQRHDCPPVNTVAGTIFPANFYLQEGTEGVYSTYPAVYPKVHKMWGTYAMRMLRKSTAAKTGKKEDQMNPLQILVEKMKKQLAHSRMRAVYEANMIEIDDLFELPIYDAALDCGRTRCQPCLSHLSFKLLPDDRVMLTVFYRYHYYIEKALGNLVGLSQLLYFVAKETGLGVGPLVCHSTYAVLDTEGGWRVKDIEELIANCRKVPMALAEQLNSTRVIV